MSLISKKALSLLCVSLALSACNNLIPPQKGDPEFAPAAPNNGRDKYSGSGSIYNPNTSLALFETLRARRVGDIVTVVLKETTDGKKSAATNGTKNDSVTLENPTLFGKPVKIGKTGTLEMQLKGDRSFTGSGDSQQKNELSGNISVTVYEVLPNGNMKVRGEKWIKINQGDEYVRLRGIIRPADINPDNTIDSHRIANASISYSGTGQVSDTNKQGWLARFFNTGFWLY